MDKKEFSIAMFLIKKTLEGATLPISLPPALRNDPQPSYVHANAIVPFGPTNNLNSNGRNSAFSSPAHTYNDWIISSNNRPRYRLLFNNHDRNKRGYLTGVEARSILLRSGLSQNVLAQIWNLADLDKDGNLNCDEFSIAYYLTEKAIAGCVIPTVLPSGLLPLNYQQRASRSPSQRLVQNQDQENSDDTQESLIATFEDKRRENFQRGQLELEKRKQELVETFRQSEAIRLENDRLEREKQEKIRLEKQRQQAAEAEKQAERLKQMETQREFRRAQTVETRMKAAREAERQQQLETERLRTVALMKEKSYIQALLEQAIAHRASLSEAASGGETRLLDLDSRLLVAQTEVDSHKTIINEMRGKRDNYERDIRELTEQIEAAKAELTRWQRELEQLSLRMAAGVNMNSVGEQLKTLHITYEVRCNSIEQCRKTLTELDKKMTDQGHELATKRNKSDELQRRITKVMLELVDLRHSVEQKSKTYQKRKKTSGAETTNDLNSDNSNRLHEAMFEFEARHPDELSLAVGDIIRIVEPDTFVQVSSGWLYGECNGKSGLFPEAYVKEVVNGKIDPFDPFGIHKTSQSSNIELSFDVTDPFANTTLMTTLNSTEEQLPQKAIIPNNELFTCVVLYPYNSDVPGDLTLEVGDIVRVYSVKDDWHEGICLRTRLRGLFPANHVKKIADQDNQVLESAMAKQMHDAASDKAFGVFATKDSTLSKDTNDLFSLSSTTPCKSTSSFDSTIAVFPSLTNASTPSPTVVNTTSGGVCSSAPTTSPPPSDLPKTDESNVDMITCVQPEFAHVTKDYVAVSDTQLNLHVGQVVQLHQRSQSATGWWKGELQQRGRERQVGWFPADHVRLVTPSVIDKNSVAVAPPINDQSFFLPSSIPVNFEQHSTNNLSHSTPPPPPPPLFVAVPPPSQSTSSKSSPNLQVEMMQTIFSYKAAHADELTFDEGDIITLLGRDEPEWWRGRLNHSGAEGLFPVNYVRPYVQPTKNPNQAADNRNAYTLKCIINEVIQTELVYKLDLVNVKDVFYSAIESSNLINHQQLVDLFPLWDKLINISEQFYIDLKTNFESNKSIGTAIEKHISNFKFFAIYCIKEQVACEKLAFFQTTIPAFKQLIINCQNSTKLVKLPLESYLLKPVQRITRYKLLFEKILKYLSPTCLPYANVSKAYNSLEHVLNVVDIAVGLNGNTVLVDWLKSRLMWSDQCKNHNLRVNLTSAENKPYLVHYGTLYRAKSGRELIGFLFTTHFLLVSPTYDTKDHIFEYPQILKLVGNKAAFTVYKEPISLNSVNICKSSPINKPELDNLFTGPTNRQSNDKFGRKGKNKSTRSKSVNQLFVHQSQAVSHPFQSGLDDLALEFDHKLPNSCFTIFDCSGCTERPIVTLQAHQSQHVDQWLSAFQKAISMSHFLNFSTINNDYSLVQYQNEGFNFELTVLRVWDNTKKESLVYFEMGIMGQSKKRFGVSVNKHIMVDRISFCIPPSKHSPPRLSISIFNSNQYESSNLIGSSILSVSDLTNGCYNAAKSINQPFIKHFEFSRGNDHLSDPIKLYNVAPDVRSDFAELFQITLWSAIFLILLVWGVCWGIWNMDPGRDGIIYRGTSSRPKQD